MRDGTSLVLGVAGLLAAGALARPSGSSARGHAWLDLDTVLSTIPWMEKQGVSEVARSPRGFIRQYRMAGGDPGELTDAWRARREAFLARHLAQVVSNGEPLWRDGHPSRRHLALVAWAYSPDPARLEGWLATRAASGSRAEDAPATLPFRARVGPWIVEWRDANWPPGFYMLALGHDSHRYAGGEVVFKTYSTKMEADRTEEELRVLTRSLVAAIGTGVLREVEAGGFGFPSSARDRLYRWIDQQNIPRIWKRKPPSEPR